MISKLVERREPGSVVIAAPTGKAAQRLREKGVNAVTIHQLAYRFEGHDEDGNPQFDFRGIRGGQKLVIVDEASMVNGEIYRDLVGGGYRMLFVGDHGQLPPVGDDPGIMREPDYALSVIHRQDDKGLLDFAHLLRQGMEVPKAWGNAETVPLDPRGESPAVITRLRDADVVICWRNNTRHWLNHLVMQHRGMIPMSLRYVPNSPPNTIEVLRTLSGVVFPVVCLRNNHRYRVFNGEVLQCSINRIGTEVADATIRRDNGSEFEALLDLKGFRLSARGYSPAENALLFDFGCCLTAHKSQGSEWSWVCVYDDTGRNMDDRPRWKYTAATRAKDYLTWLHY